MTEIEKKINDTIWVAHTLFKLGRATGSSSNISFKYNNKIYISATNSSFGRLTLNDFSIIDMEGICTNEVIPSKEWPMHLMLYKFSPEMDVVIHTHSTYSTLWSCLDNLNMVDAVPSYTPYLEMKVGKVRVCSYEKPGSKELFKCIDENIDGRNAYLLAHHGPVVIGKGVLNTFYSIEELEESCRIAWLLEGTKYPFRKISNI